MKIDSMIESKYLKQSDIGDAEVVVTVAAEPKKVNVARKDEEADYRYIIKFHEFEKPMVLNTTNIKRMGKALGEDTVDWIGNQVIVFVDPDVSFGGNTVGGLRIRTLTRGKTPARNGNIDDANRNLRDADSDAPF